MRLLNLLRKSNGVRGFDRIGLRLRKRNRTSQIAVRNSPRKSRYAHGQSGSTFLEFALTLPVFLTVVLTATELIRSYFEYALLQHAVHRASRYAALDYKEDGLNPVESVLYKINELSGLTVRPEDFHICSTSEYPCATNNRGTSEGWVQIGAKLRLNLLFGGFQPTLTASAVVRNEPKFNGITLPEDEGPFGNDDGGEDDPPPPDPGDHQGCGTKCEGSEQGGGY